MTSEISHPCSFCASQNQSSAADYPVLDLIPEVLEVDILSVNGEEVSNGCPVLFHLESFHVPQWPLERTFNVAHHFHRE